MDMLSISATDMGELEFSYGAAFWPEMIFTELLLRKPFAFLNCDKLFE